MNIIITHDFICEFDCSYHECRRKVDKGDSLIITSSRNAFKFVNVDRGYEVIALNRDGSYCRITEVLGNSYPYCDKRIVRAHNAYKMLKAGLFSFRKTDQYSESALTQCGAIVEPSSVSEGKLVEVYVDYIPDGGVASFAESEQAIALGRGFRTACFEYFDFTMLDMGYSVIALKRDGGFCDLSEFLSNIYPYMDKSIRRNHNAEKFLASDAISFRP